MPEIVRCKICGKRMKVKGFNDRMTKIREHLKKNHPRAWKKSIKKGVETRKKNQAEER